MRDTRTNIISKECDFLNIFKEQLGETYIDNQTWNEIIQLNLLLTEFLFLYR